MAARPNNIRGGRKPRVAEQPGKPMTVRFAAEERAVLARLAAAWGLSESAAIRRAVGEAATQQGVSR